jgi:hypothetical protein
MDKRTDLHESSRVGSEIGGKTQKIETERPSRNHDPTKKNHKKPSHKMQQSVLFVPISGPSTPLLVAWNHKFELTKYKTQWLHE